MAEACALVIGAGLAGAAVAHALAQRGWTVDVLDCAAAPAAGASSLPAGVLAPHVSPDDALLSQITRAGVAMTLDFARRQLVHGHDWAQTGVLERRLDGRPALPIGTALASVPATPAHKAAAGLAVGDVATWHAAAGWVKPAALVRALLARPGVRFVGAAPVAGLRCQDPGAGDGAHWVATDALGRRLGSAPVAVVCAGWASAALLGDAWPLRPIRGQLTLGVCSEASDAAAPFPVNGHGSWLPRVPLAGGDTWLAGATFERDRFDLPDIAATAYGHTANLERLRVLLPAAAAAASMSGERRAWHGVRGAYPDRLPAVGPVDAHDMPGLWTSSGMGARGISLALLCGELLAARLCGEALPLAPRLARALAVERLAKWRPGAASISGEISL